MKNNNFEKGLTHQELIKHIDKNYDLFKKDFDLTRRQQQLIASFLKYII